MLSILQMKIGNITNPLTEEVLDEKTLKQSIEKTRAQFYSYGLQRGDKAIIYHGNHPQFFVDLFSLWELGVCAIPVDASTSENELDKLIQHSGAKLIIHKGNLESTDSSLQNLNTVNLHNSFAEATNENQTFKDQNVQFDDAALMLYTSGTTGSPKGVLHTFRSLFARLFLLRNHVPLDACKNTICLLPTHFGHGLICNCLFPLVHGCNLFIMPPFNMQHCSQMGEIIDKFDITFMSSVPTIWNMILRLSEKPTKNTLQRIHCGSAPLSEDLWTSIKEWSSVKDVINTYGITETGSWLAGTEMNKSSVQDGYIGYGWGTEIVIKDNESGEELPPNKPGDVWAYTPAIMKEYYKAPELTEQVLKNNWFWTGDIGYKNDDGALVLVGRKRHEINRGGMKVYPEDIDIVLMKHPQVMDACAFAVPDELAGQLVGAAVVFDGDSTTTDDLDEWCRQNLADYKVPSKWYEVKEIPRTSRGKINRDNVAKHCMEQ